MTSCRLLFTALLLFSGLARAVTCHDATIPPSNPDSVYTDHGNGTVTDGRTGLTWKRCAEGQTWSGGTCAGSALVYTWSAALAVAEAASFAGQSDWRLPNVKELSSLVEECRSRPAINDTIFPNAPSSYSFFWSGSPNASYSGYAWLVHFFAYGKTHPYGSVHDYYSVWLVRGGQSFDTFATIPAAEAAPPVRTEISFDALIDGRAVASQKKAVLITHGWNSDAASWVAEMAQDICIRKGAWFGGIPIGAYIKENNATLVCQADGWDVWVYDWRGDTATRQATGAVNNARRHGEPLAKGMMRKEYAKIHFIAHSAGSNLIDSTTFWLKAWARWYGSVTPVIQETFLDAYGPWGEASTYGEYADWADNYVDMRPLVWGSVATGLDGTNLKLSNAYNIDVTPVNDGCNNILDTDPVCRHSRPYRYYGLSVNSDFVGYDDYKAHDPVQNTANMGYPLSIANGQTPASMNTMYPKGRTCWVDGNVCRESLTDAAPWATTAKGWNATLDAALGVASWVADGIVPGLGSAVRLGQWLANLPLASGRAQALSARVGANDATAPAETPSLLALQVDTLEPVNTLRFNWRFAEAGEGYLRIFVDGEAVREIDQRHVTTASPRTEEVYIGGESGSLPAGAHRITFRLDGFGTSASGVEVTHIELAMRQAISDVAGSVATLAGTGTAAFSGDGGLARYAALSAPSGVAVDGAGNIYLADTGNHRVRRIAAATGFVATVAGTGSAGYGGDGGPASSAGLNAPAHVALDAAGDLYIADQGNHRVRKLTVSTGVMSTVAGTGVATYSGDGGPATSAGLSGPAGLAIDAAGSLYIADSNNQRIRRVAAGTGVIATVAGSGTAGYGGDGGAATSAMLSAPQRVALDRLGNLYIADRGNHRIRQVAATTGIISTVAGTGDNGYSGDGLTAGAAALSSPGDVRVDGAGNIFIADSGNHRIRHVATTTGIITTLAGSGTPGYSGDGGAAASALLTSPQGLALDPMGTLYIADTGTHRVRQVYFVGSQPPGVPTDVGLAAGEGQVTVRFIAPEINGGAAITSYTATCTASGQTTRTASGTGSPITVTGLTSGVAYACTVTATNAGGTSAASATSNSVIPALASQTISFGAVPILINGGTATVSATASSGLAVSFSSITPTMCSISGTTVTALAIGTCTIAANQAGNSNYSAAPQATQDISVTAPLTLVIAPGWNLVGNGVDAPITVASAFNDAAKVTSVWKWVPSGSTLGISYPAWAFYAPALADGGQVYAAGKGYDFLVTINAGEGFWVNAKAGFSLALGSGATVPSTAFMPATTNPVAAGGAHALPRGWSLIATGDAPTPAQFDAALATALTPPPAQGQVYGNLTTLWAWDTSRGGWYFWAPSLVNSGGLANYLTGKGYLDFATLPGTPVGTLSPTTGFWVNMP